MENKEENQQSLRVSLFPKKSHLDWDVETWSYTIKGNKAAKKINSEISDLIQSFATPEEKQQQFIFNHASRNYTLSEEERKKKNDARLEIKVELIHRAYKWIIRLAKVKKSRLVYFVIAIFLMVYRVKIPAELKEQVIDYASFEKYEAHQFSDERLARERKKRLANFIELVQNHQEGVKTLVPFEALGEIYENTPPDENGKKYVALPNIDYSL